MVSYRSTPPDYQRPPPRPGYPGAHAPKSRWLLYTLPVIAIFVGFATIVWLAYLEGAPASALGDPPLIQAETTPIKLPPEEPGGREVADRGAVSELLGESEGERTERLLPPPEEPLTPSAEELAAAASRLEATVDDPPTGSAPAEPAGREAGASQEPTPRPQEETREGSTEPARSGGDLRSTILATDEPPADTEAAIRELFRDIPSAARRPQVLRPEPVQRAEAEGEPQPGEREVARATPDPRPAAEAEPTAPVEAQPQAEAQQQHEPAPAAEPAEPAAQSAADRPTNGAGAPAEQEPRTVTPAVALANRGPAPDPADQALLEGPHFRVQLAAVRNEADAQRAWDLFMVDFGEVLAGIEPIFERGETTNGVFYRVQLGPYASLARAEAMCEELKQRNASCFVLRR